jgi:hypothetical protein
MRINQLLENNTAVSRRQPLSAAQVVEMLPNYEHAWHKYLAGDAVYRGVSRDEGQGGRSWIDPRSRARTSANTSNLYTLFVDSDHRWANYPDRSKSLICTNTWRTAKSYGDPHVVLLANHSRIGICSEDDWWLSFDHLLSKLKKYKNTAIYDMSDLNTTLAKAYRIVTGRDINLSDAAALRSDLNTMGMILREHDLSEWSSLGRSEQYVMQQSGLFELFQSQDLSMTDLLSELLDPQANGFSLTTVEAYQQPEAEKELWSDGTALMLDMAAVAQLKTDLGVD